ncbi:hypothetical protein [Pseudofrankia asymbiotica]|uniref:Uncharacterized protein n=1 Tax=Pseudofrankia asymbiotica TaxID=1834516 RepID=A0A1V2I222_9ACTN|nr:hypothetical protein [Pseudofrankia asymbiotica]ONH23642.1 hypothetical protein BL253_32235 [Pseudofrankia asymbiotica]
MPYVVDRRFLLRAFGAPTVVAMSFEPQPNLEPLRSTTDLHQACSAALSQAISSYETSDLTTTASSMRPLESTTRTIPRQRRLRGRDALDWMRLHAAVTMVSAGTDYDRGLHSDAAARSDRAASLARAAGDGPLAARALALRARLVRQHSPAVSLQIAGAAARIAGHSPARAMIAGKVVAGAYAAAGDLAGVRDAVARAWRTMEQLDDNAYGRPGFALETYSPADLALASAEALTTVGAAEDARPYLEKAYALIKDSGQTGMIVSVLMAQARASVSGDRPDHFEAAEHAAAAVALAADRPAEWVARLVRDVSGLAEQRTGHALDDLVAATAAWV